MRLIVRTDNKKRPKHLVLDVDGTLSTGQFLYSENGKKYKIFGAHDNDGLKLLKDRIQISFITADKRGFRITERRIRDMGQSVTLVPEIERLQYIAKNFGLSQTIYMGDGIFDAPILKACQFGIAPRNARKEARAAAKYVTPSNAGEGAVLDACLKIQSKFFQKQ